jgi:murein DD-endopeptidase MepM/ murein hydrolase activator NlpD
MLGDSTATPDTWTLARAAAVLIGSAILVSSCSGSNSGSAVPPAGPVTTATTPALTRNSPPTPSPVVRSKPVGFAFPIAAKARFGPTHHDYPATDIFARCGSTVVAPTSGVIREVSRKDMWNGDADDGADRGGLSYSMVDAQGVRYYGSHLRTLQPSIRPGAAVKEGDQIGSVGNSGDAAGLACHLHFGISPACGTGDWWIRRGAISPYPFLKAWQDGENLSPARAVAAWKAEHGCPANPPKAD